MKKTLYKGTYKIVSWLSDMTGGAALFVKWKMALAVVVLGLSAGALASCEPMITCYDPALPSEEQGTDDGTKTVTGTGTDTGTGTGTGTGTETEDDPGILCYAPALPPEEQQ